MSGRRRTTPRGGHVLTLGQFVPRKIPARTLDRLQIHERTPSGRARNYVDPVTGELFSARERQQGRSGLSIETQREINRSGHAKALERALQRGETAPGYLIEKYRDKLASEGKSLTKTAIVRDRNFWRELDKLHPRQTIRDKKTGRRSYAPMSTERGKERLEALYALGVISASQFYQYAELYGDDDGSDGMADDDYSDFYD